MLLNIWQSCLFLSRRVIAFESPPKHFSLATSKSRALLFLCLDWCILHPFCSCHPFFNFLNWPFVKRLTWDSRNVKSILVAIAATLLISVLTWRCRQQRRDQRQIMSFLFLERVLLHLVCSCTRGWRASAAPRVRKWPWDKIGSSVQYWPSQASYSKTGMYPITCVSSVRKGGAFWEGMSESSLVGLGSASWVEPQALCHSWVSK